MAVKSLVVNVEKLVLVMPVVAMITAMAVKSLVVNAEKLALVMPVVVTSVKPMIAHAEKHVPVLPVGVYLLTVLLRAKEWATFIMFLQPSLL